MSDKRSRPQDDLPAGLARPARRALASVGVTRLDQLSDFTQARIAALHGMGPTGMDRLRAALAARGLAFRPF